jgi:predicted transcriptional regulator
MKDQMMHVTMEDVWKQTSTMDILIFLSEKKQGILSDFIYGMRKNPNTINRAVELLVKAGLIQESTGNYNSRLFTITDRGIRIADLARKQKELFDTRVSLN